MISRAMFASFGRTEVQNFRISELLTFLFFPFFSLIARNTRNLLKQKKNNTMRGAITNKIGTSEVQNYWQGDRTNTSMPSSELPTVTRVVQNFCFAEGCCAEGCLWRRRVPVQPEKV
jgi:hypothetical protein